MLNALYSFAVWSLWLVALLLLGLPAVLLTVLAPEAGFRFVRAASGLVLRLSGMPVRIRGAERVDWSRAYVVMGNHQSMIDPFAILGAFPRRPVCIEKVENLKLPVYGWLTRAWGNIPIKREDREQAIAGVDSAKAKLAEGFNIGIMPEGTRTHDGRIGAFKKGGFHLAIGAGADILPFTINGSYERLQRKSWRLQPGAIEIVFGEPVPTAGYTKENLEALIERVRAVVLSNYQGSDLERRVPAPESRVPS